MNTQTHVHRLQAGQALALPTHGGGLAVLTEGELLVQKPARWLGGSAVMPTAMRIGAPAVLPAGAHYSFVASGPASVVVEGPTPSAIGRALRSAAAWMAGVLGGTARGSREPLPH